VVVDHVQPSVSNHIGVIHNNTIIPHALRGDVEARHSQPKRNNHLDIQWCRDTTKLGHQLSKEGG